MTNTQSEETYLNWGGGRAWDDQGNMYEFGGDEFTVGGKAVGPTGVPVPGEIPVKCEILLKGVSKNAKIIKLIKFDTYQFKGFEIKKYTCQLGRKITLKNFNHMKCKHLIFICTVAFAIISCGGNGSADSMFGKIPSMYEKTTTDMLQDLSDINKAIKRRQKTKKRQTTISKKLKEAFQKMEDALKETEKKHVLMPMKWLERLFLMNRLTAYSIQSYRTLP